MLFDLRGRGRRRTVQAIYLGLAILMGGGLVLFGIGSNSNGGIVDAVVGGTGGVNATKALDKRIQALAVKTRTAPREPSNWAELARLRYQRAGLDGVAADGQTYLPKGKVQLGLAADAWEQYLRLDPKAPNTRIARLMVQAYGPNGLKAPSNAVRAMQIVTAGENPPSSNLFAQLAVLAYTAGDTRIGDLATTRAVDLAPKASRKLLRTQIEQRKAQLASQGSQAAPSPSG